MNQLQFVFIASGIGITPFRSMIRSLIDTKKTVQILLLYKTRTQDMLFKDLFTQAKTHGVQTHYVSENEDIDASTIKKYIPQPHTPTYYLSGPQATVEEQRSMLMELGIPANQIKTDLFSGYM